MPQIQGLIQEYKKELLILGALLILLVLVEVFLFNGRLLLSKVLGLQERHFSVRDGILYQFNLEDGKLIAQSGDPNITFDNINHQVASISIGCNNSTPGAIGQVFYRSEVESFSEDLSVRYEASVPNQMLPLNQILGFPKPVKVSSLRIDLTNIPGDIISCSEFVINPHISFKVSRVRLASYAAFFLLAILTIFRNVKPIVYIKSANAVYTSLFLVLAVTLGIKLMPFAISNRVIFVVVLCILMFSVAVTYALAYSYFDSGLLQGEKGSIIERYKYEIAIATVMVITTLPFLTESFFYYDDWWILGNKAFLTQENLFRNARPIYTLTFAVFDNIGIANAYILRWAALPAAILYAVVLYRWLRSKMEDDYFAFLLACVLSVFAPIMDCLGYGSITPLSYSILFSALSVTCFERAATHDWQRERIYVLFNVILAFTMLLVAMLTYQVGIQIVFVLLTLAIYFNPQKRSLLRFNVAFLFLFTLSNGFYLLFVKFLRWAYHIQAYRSQTLDSASQIVEKVNFYKSVVSQSIMQVIASFTGGSLILERFRGYYISFSNPPAGNLLFIFVVIMVVVAFVNYWFRTKSFAGLLSLLLFIPMSYFVFLILSESGYLTYYAIAHLSLFMFYFVVGFVISAQFLWEKIKRTFPNGNTISIMVVKPAHIVAPLLVVCALVSNYYIRDFYINYNNAVYDFVKHSLGTALKSGDPKRIHIYGLISPIHADVYSRFVAETALKDLGETPADYQITFSPNRYFLMRMEEVDYNRIRDQLSGDDKRELDKTYTFGATYSQYYIKAWPSEEDQKKLQRIFMLAGAIPQTTSPDILIIDLTWTDEAYNNRTKYRSDLH